MVLGLSLISDGKLKQKCSSLSKFPQTGQNARQLLVLVLLPLCGVFSNWKGGGRALRTGPAGIAGALLPSCGNSFKTP